MKKLTPILLVCVLAVFAFSGCMFFMSAEDRVAKYVERSRSSIEEIAESAKDTMDISCFAEGKSMIIQYDYKIDLSPDPETVAKTLDSIGETYKAMYDELARYAGDEDVSVIIRYNGKDGGRITDYVIDKDYVPGENASEFDPRSYKTVAEYVRSEPFKSMISSQDDEYFTYSADVENDTTVVLFHKLKYEYDAEDLAAIKADWDENMQSGGEASVLSMKAAVGVVIKDVEIDVVYRLLDCEGNVLSEYGAD